MSLIPLRRGIGFTVFPPEVREMIFKFALSGSVKFMAEVQD